MGKSRQKGGLSGISRFVRESMMASTSANSNGQNDSSKATHTNTQLLSEKEKLRENQTLKKSAERDGQAGGAEDRPAKKRKTNNESAVVEELTSTQRDGGSGWISKYDASGLVPHYTEASQVPEHLQKCASFL